MSDYPTVDAVIQESARGVFPGRSKIVLELMAMLKQLEAQKKKIDGFCQPIVITDEMVRQENTSILSKVQDEVAQWRKRAGSWGAITTQQNEKIAEKDQEITQLSKELLETQKDVSFLRVKELREEIKQLRRQRDCLYEHFGIGLYVSVSKDIIEVLDEIDNEQE